MKDIAFEKYKLSDKRPFLTVGMFDGVHSGHRCLLHELVSLSSINDTESVVVSFPVHPRKVLGTTDGGFALLDTQDERVKKIASCGADWLLWLNFDRQLASLEASEFLDLLIEKINPCEVLVGYDNRFGRKDSREFDDIVSKGEYKGVRVRRSDCKVICEGLEVSSTQIRKLLAEGNVSLAQKMLSNPYSICGNVEVGRQIGRQIGFPTANITPNPGKLLPKYGVYAVRVLYGGGQYGGVLNLGGKPTIDKAERSCEVHILNFSEQIYGRQIEIEFIEYLRCQKGFETLEELKMQIEKDCDEAEKVLGVL